MSEIRPEYEAPSVEELDTDGKPIMEPAGIEPATSALQRRRSAS
jgi:hypothetical protein